MAEEKDNIQFQLTEELIEKVEILIELKNDKELFMPPKSDNTEKEAKSKSLNDKLSSKDIKVDLNNRLAFVKHLFGGRDVQRIESGGANKGLSDDPGPGIPESEETNARFSTD